ncbi:phage tail protein [Kineosporia sp. J2-2]|uniref:Phage tail protein n=1 Tax=Kineosporia corallincola TaxID=2835133 RepID=A0ABS5TAW5_9ACTN|nr:phage tail protein [Kineosporia corallincola]MBT0768215.1 phage tail protein [Kineosporia corallincola]
MPSLLDTSVLSGAPPTAANFLLEVDGQSIGTFGSVKGLSVSVAVESYTEGGNTGFVHQFPGQMSWPNLVFGRGLTDSDNLFAWMNRTAGHGFQAAGARLERTTACVVLLDTTGTRMRSWEFDDAFPVRWNGPDFDSSRGTPVTEELEVAHHGFKAKAP